ncbi:FkbM family methyltransferase [Alphaproteobacteria bacterium]|nr:FkbM family methyltransferase [Alphaproteobacteria bacterium]
MRSLKVMYSKYCPDLIKKIYRQRKVNRILLFYDGKVLNDEETVVLKNIKENGVRMFPYSFVEKYDFDLDVHCDDLDNQYVLHHGKKLFFPKDLTHAQIKTKYLALLAEQDPESPHNYFTDDFKVDENDVFFDIGSAEGLISLDVIERVKKAFIFECEEKWSSALSLTFSDYRNRAEIVNKYVSDKDIEGHAKIDGYVKSEYDSLVFKLDVEGSEMEVLKGMNGVLSSNVNIKIAICTYHRNEDFEEISSYLGEKGFDIKTSTGYMIFDPLNPPYLRRGLIRATKRV